MLQLIAKDILIQKKTFFIGLIYVVIMIVSLQSFGSDQGNAMLPAGVVSLTYILALTACALDDKNKADVMLNSLPVGRHLIVLARYVSAFVFATVGVIDYIIVAGIIRIANIPVKAQLVSVEGVIASLFAVSLIVGIYYPVYFKLGYIKSRMVNFILFFTVFFGIGVLSSLVKDAGKGTAVNWIVTFFSDLSGTQIAFGMLVLMLFILTCSYLLSVKFYKSREF